MEKARDMLADQDLMDRLYLFMFHLWKLAPGQGLDALPYNGKYFDDKEINELSEYSRISDGSATPDEILLSLEQVFPPLRIKDSDGVWRNAKQRYINWIQNEKLCRPGTLKGRQAELMFQIHLENEEIFEREEEEEREKQKREAEKRKKAAQRGKETRERKKKEVAAAKSAGVGESHES